MTWSGMAETLMEVVVVDERVEAIECHKCGYRAYFEDREILNATFINHYHRCICGRVL